MASTQKKTTSNKKTSEKKTDTKAKAKGKAAKEKPAAYAPNMAARGVGAAVCLFLAVLLVLALIFRNRLKAVVKSLVNVRKEGKKK